MDGLKKIVRAVRSLKWYETIMCIVMLVISVYYAIKPIEGCPQWLAIINMISGLCGVMCVFLTANHTTHAITTTSPKRERKPWST